MKRILTFALAAAVMLSAAVMVNAEGEYKPTTYNTAKGTATVDGVMDEAYLQSDEILVEEGGLERDLLDGHATAKVRTLWDEKYFYFYAEVNDPTPGGVPTPDDAVWNNESIEFYIDYENNKSDINFLTDTDKAGQMRICRYADSCPDITGVGAVRFIDDINYKVADNGEKGYIVEVSVAHHGRISDKMGFAFQINDDMDGDKVRDSVIYIHAEQADAWKNTSTLDTVNLVGYVAPEPSEAPSSEAPSSETPSKDEPSKEESAPTASVEDTSPSSHPIEQAGNSAKINPAIIIAIVAAVAVIAVVIVISLKKEK